MGGRGRGSAKGSSAPAKGSSAAPSPAEAQAAPRGRRAPRRRKEDAPQPGPEDEQPAEGRKASRKSRGESAEEGAGASPAQGDEAAAAAAPRRKRTGPRARRAPAEAGAQTPLEPRPVRSLREVLKTLALRQQAVSKASERVNSVQNLLLAAIRRDPRFSSIEKRGTGSYYERLKISKPDEFDIMLKLPQLRFELEPCAASASSGAFYFVKLKRNPGKENLSDFLDDNEHLSAFKMLAAIRSIIIKEVKKIEEEKVQVEKKKPGCPAVTLLIGEPPSTISVDIILALEGGHCNQCVSTKDGFNVDGWLGKKVKQEFRFAPLCLVPKNVKDGKCLIDCWRLSFSHIEKNIIMNHGSEKTCCEKEGKKCCRKACLKLLKYLLELLKTKHENRNQFDKFFSYHAKTALFQACVKWPHDSEWLETDLDDCFEKFLDFFLDCLRNAELRNFFIPEFNFFSTDRIGTGKCKVLAKAIESERNNRFPLFSLEP